jgi:hypothetical protein
MNNNLEFENEDPSPDNIEDNHPRTNYGEGFYKKETLTQRVSLGLDRELQRQKKAGKQFLSNDEIDKLVDNIIKEEMGDAWKESYKESYKEPKQEPTLEEIRKYAELSYYNGDEINAFVNGAKWQADRMYSEEDLRNAYRWGTSVNHGTKEHFNEWLEQYKKK